MTEHRREKQREYNRRSYRKYRETRLAAQRARRAASFVVPAGVSPLSWKAKAMWARRRTKYGPSGMSATGLASLRSHMVTTLHPKRDLLAKNRRTCKRGHTWTAANTYWCKGSGKGGMRRKCRACRTLNDVQARSRVRQQRQDREALTVARMKMIETGIKSNQFPESARWRRLFEKARAAYYSIKDSEAASERRQAARGAA